MAPNLGAIAVSWGWVIGLIIMMRVFWHWLWFEPPPDPDCPWWPQCRCKTEFQCIEWNAW